MKTILLTLLLAGCTKEGWEVIEGAPPPPPGSKIELVQIQPAPGTVLNAGETVRFRATVRYNVTSPRGMIQLMAQDAQTKPIARHVEYVNSGPGIRDLELEIKVPASEFLTIYTPLMNQYQGSTSVVTSETYPIRHAL
jgi:hypothetical protein